MDEAQPLNAYPELAASDSVLQDLLNQLETPLENVINVYELRQIVDAESGSDASLVRLTVSHGNPVDATRLANSWARLFVTWANEIYGDLGGGQVAFFESQLTDTSSPAAWLETSDANVFLHDDPAALSSLAALGSPYLPVNRVRRPSH